MQHIPDFESLKNSNIFEGIMDSMNDGILIVNLNDKIIYANKKICEITGYNLSELIGYQATELLNKDFVSEMEGKIKERNRYFSDSYELTLIKKNGKKVWVRISASPILDLDNKVVGSIGVHTDITERKNQDKILSKTLKEKELLLQETHHRVKNNMQLVSSLMSLQAAELRTAEDAKVAFITCQKRIKSIAVLHEIIYKCGDSGKIDFNIYCEKIINELKEVLGFSSQKTTIKQTCSIGSMNMENALTCGMLINELVINCSKHAFYSAGGEINISISSEKNTTILKIEDNGKGLPSGFSLTKGGSLGFLLIGAFVEQLDGNVEIKNNNGASFIITFPTKS
ncbi:MAG: PAS domain S-box protein [Flavobacteriales bacterium]|nr:PAS domain S-box protein [Flavobacteriales bacterium]